MCELRKIACTGYILRSISAPCWHIMMSSKSQSHSVMSGECNNLHSCFQKCYTLLAELCIAYQSSINIMYAPWNWAQEVIRIFMNLFKQICSVALHRSVQHITVENTVHSSSRTRGLMLFCNLRISNLQRCSLRCLLCIYWSGHTDSASSRDNDNFKVITQLLLQKSHWYPASLILTCQHSGTFSIFFRSVPFYVLYAVI